MITEVVMRVFGKGSGLGRKKWNIGKKFGESSRNIASQCYKPDYPLGLRMNVWRKR